MTLREHLEEELRRVGVRVLTGRRSQCHMSISCFTPPMCGRRGVVSVNPSIEESAAICEALAVQLALIIQSGGPKRFRLTAGNYRAIWMAKAWRLAAKLSIDEWRWRQAMAARLEGRDIEEQFGVTRRIVQLRWNMWVAKSGNLGPLLVDAVDLSMTNREPAHMWCDVV